MTSLAGILIERWSVVGNGHAFETGKISAIVPRLLDGHHCPFNRWVAV